MIGENLPSELPSWIASGRIFIFIVGFIMLFFAKNVLDIFSDITNGGGSWRKYRGGMQRTLRVLGLFWLVVSIFTRGPIR